MAFREGRGGPNRDDNKFMGFSEIDLYLPYAL
jgi:hypothetical protein